MNKDDKLLSAYLLGFCEACEYVLDGFQETGLVKGDISDESLSGLYARLAEKYNQKSKMLKTKTRKY